MQKIFKKYKNIQKLLSISYPHINIIVNAVNSGVLKKDNFFESASKRHALCTAQEMQKIINRGPRGRTPNLPPIQVRFRIDCDIFPIKHIIASEIVDEMGDILLTEMQQDQMWRYMDFERISPTLPIWGMISFGEPDQKQDIEKFIKLYFVSEYLEYFLDVYAEYHKYKDYIATVVFADKRVDIFGSADYSFVVDRLAKKTPRADLHLMLFLIEQKNLAHRHDSNQHKGIEFEVKIIEGLRSLGISAIPTKRQGDFGADIIIHHEGIGVCVQCKNLTAPVGVKGIQEVVSSIKFYNCDFGMVVSASGYTDAAIELAAKNKIRLSNPSGYIENVMALFRGH